MSHLLFVVLSFLVRALDFVVDEFSFLVECVLFGLFSFLSVCYYSFHFSHVDLVSLLDHVELLLSSLQLLSFKLLHQLLSEMPLLLLLFQPRLPLTVKIIIINQITCPHILSCRMTLLLLPHNLPLHLSILLLLLLHLNLPLQIIELLLYLLFFISLILLLQKQLLIPILQLLQVHVRSLILILARVRPLNLLNVRKL